MDFISKCKAYFTFILGFCMCGILGIVSNQPVGFLVLEGLKKLEYRGYDSCGVASVDGTLHVRKGVGKIEDVDARVGLASVSGNLAVGHCLHPDTWIQLANGEVRRIRDVADESVYALSFENLKFTEKTASCGKHASPHTLMILRTSSFSLKCTLNHRMFVFQDGQIVEKQAGQIKKGDLMLCANGLSFSGNSQELVSIPVTRYYFVSEEARKHFKEKCTEKKLSLAELGRLTGVSISVLGHLSNRDRNLREDVLEKISLVLNMDKNYFTPTHSVHGNFIHLPSQSSPELMEFLGYLMGNGIVNQRNIRFKDADRSILEHYQQRCLNLFNVRGRIVKVPESNAFLFEVNSKDLCNWLRLNFPEICRRGKAKTIPSAVGRMPNQEVNAFIRGLFDAEGSVSLSSRQLSIRMVTESVLRIVQLFLLRSNVVASFHEYATYRGPAYALVISHRDAISRFQNEVGFNAYAKKSKLNELLLHVSNRSTSSFKIPFDRKSLQPFSIRKKDFYSHQLISNGFIESALENLNSDGTAMLEPLLQSDVLFQRVIGTQRIESDTDYVYDLYVPEHHNFIANGFVSHNSRWATHGGVTDSNAHPHLDCRGEVAVVHNGIIENYQELRKNLQAQGHHFASETDSEVIAHLIESAPGNLEARVQAAVKQLHGSFALLAVSVREPDKMVAVRKESPMAIGLAKDHTFVASDVMPFLSHTKQAVFLEDYEMAVVRPGHVQYLDARSGKHIQKTPRTLDWDEQAASKEGHAHYMFKEILEQPQAIKNALRQDPKKLDAFVELLRESRDVKFVACGTSRHAALVGRYALNQLTGKSAEAYIASEFDYFADQCTKDTLIVAVSQSGETADVLVGLRKAKAKGAKIAAIVNVAGSSIDRESDVCLYLNCGPEIAVASTKAFIAQLTVFFALAHAVAGKLPEGVKAMTRVADQVAEFLPSWDVKSRELAASWPNVHHMYYLARGVNFPVALEGALKMKEISYIHAEGMPAGELKHGTLALIERKTPVVLLNPTDYTFADTLSNGLETKARGAFLVGVSDENNEAYDAFIELPKAPALFYPLLSAVPLQLLAYYASVQRGLNPDTPRNLAKSVTVR